MTISEFCIRRPVATLLMSVSLVIAGLFAYISLPVAALPRADFRSSTSRRTLPGASPETMATSVATPLIKQFATIAGIDSISTTNSLGSTSIAIQFELDRDIDAAALPTCSRRSPAPSARCRDDMPAPPSYRKVNPADAPILLLALKSDIVPLTDLDAFAQQVISPSLSTMNGVAQVSIFGSQKFAVRIQLDPDGARRARHLGSTRSRRPSPAANQNTPLGTLQGNQQQLTIVADTQLDNAAASPISSSRPRRQIRCGLATSTRVIDSVADNQTASWYDGTRAIILAVQRQPDANTVAVVDRSRRCCRRFENELPAAAVARDCSTTARTSIRAVGQRRRVHAGADDRAGDHGDLPVPAAGLGDDHPGACRADLADRHARRDVPARLFASTTSR